MRIYLLILFISFSISSISQNNFTLIDTTSSHNCNNELYNEYKNKFELLNKNISYSNSGEKNIIKEIYNETQKEFLETIQNDKFLCDNTISPYLNGLFNEVLSRNNIDSKGYKILLSKDSEVNAANLGNGIVVLNYGLFLDVENEDELVFVISHEIGHQYLNHVKKEIENFAKISTSKEVLLKTKEIRNQKYLKSTSAINLLKSISYQNYNKRRKKEIEADSLGFIFYKKTSRNQNSAISLLEKLNNSDLEIDSLTINDYKTIFEKDNFKIKEKYFQQEESIFRKYDDEKRFQIDSLKSHPDCKTRIVLLKNFLENKTSIKTSETNLFNNFKKNSINQNLFNLYSDKKYGLSLYECLKLYKLDINNDFYKRIIYLNLIKIYNSRKDYTINRYVESIDNKHNTNSQNRFISFINNIKTDDFQILINNFKA